MNTLETAVYLSVFGLVAFTIVALLRSFYKHDLYQERLAMLQDNNPEPKKDKVDLKKSFKKLTQGITKLFIARSYTENVQLQLISAGIPLKAEEFLTLRLALISLMPVILYLISNNLWLAIIALIIGAIAPTLYINHKKDSRLQLLNHQLGDALVVMANALRSGFGFQQAMDTVRREMPAPITTEFSWALREMNLGFSTEEALLNLSHRVKSEDMDMVITGIIIQRQVGGNLAEILDNISNTIRDRSNVKKQINILTAQGRLSGLIIGLLPLFLVAIMLVINPGYFDPMTKDLRGIIIIVTSVVLEFIGIIIIKKITDIDF